MLAWGEEKEAWKVSIISLLFPIERYATDIGEENSLCIYVILFLRKHDNCHNFRNILKIGQKIILKKKKQEKCQDFCTKI